MPVLIPLQDIDRKKQVNIEEIYQKQAQEPLQDDTLFTVYADVTDGTIHEICYVHQRLTTITNRSTSFAH